MSSTTLINLHRTPDAPYGVFIGRPGPWGNPFSHLPNTLAKYRVKTRNEAIDKYGAWIMEQPHLLAQLESLRGKVLGCFCVPKRCHGHILIKLLSLKI